MTGSIVAKWLRLVVSGNITLAGLWCRVHRGVRAGGIYLDQAPGLQKRCALYLRFALQDAAKVPAIVHPQNSYSRKNVGE